MAHIIIVEDNTELRYAYTRIIRAAGYTAHDFANYLGVTELLDTGCGDLLIADLVLTQGTPHGLALASMARMHRSTLAVILVTGNTDLLPYVPDGMSVLVKPISDDVLLASVKAALEGR